MKIKDCLKSLYRFALLSIAGFFILAWFAPSWGWDLNAPNGLLCIGAMALIGTLLAMTES